IGSRRELGDGQARCERHHWIAGMHITRYSVESRIELYLSGLRVQNAELHLERAWINCRFIDFRVEINLIGSLEVICCGGSEVLSTCGQRPLPLENRRD